MPIIYVRVFGIRDDLLRVARAAGLVGQPMLMRHRQWLVTVAVCGDDYPVGLALDSLIREAAVGTWMTRWTGLLSDDELLEDRVASNPDEGRCLPLQLSIF